MADNAERLTLRSVGPSFTVGDVEKSLAWYRDVMGFEVGERWEENGTLLGAELKAGPVMFMIGQDDWKKGRDRRKGEGMRIYIDTAQNVDQLAADAKKAGIALDAEPHDTDMGSRAFEVTEPSGFKLTIGSETK